MNITVREASWIFALLPLAILLGFYMGTIPGLVQAALASLLLIAKVWKLTKKNL